MAGTVHRGGEFPDRPNARNGTLYLRDEGHSMVRAADRWAVLGSSPAAGCQISDDFFADAGATLPKPWGTQDTSAAGSPTLDYSADAAGGAYILKLATTNEAEAITLYFADQLVIDSTKKPYFAARIKIEADVTGAGGALGASDAIAIGLASARQTQLDDAAKNVWFRLEGANNNVLVESDDATTDDDDNDTGSDWTDGSWHTYEIDMTDLSKIRFYFDGEPVATLAAAAMTGNLQPFIEVRKAAAANFDHRATIDWITVAWNR